VETFNPGLEQAVLQRDVEQTFQLLPSVVETITTKSLISFYTTLSTLFPLVSTSSVFLWNTTCSSKWQVYILRCTWGGDIQPRAWASSTSERCWTDISTVTICSEDNSDKIFDFFLYNFVDIVSTCKYKFSISLKYYLLKQVAGVHTQMLTWAPVRSYPCRAILGELWRTRDVPLCYDST